MRATAVFVPLLLSLSSAYAIPDGTGEGAYTAYIDARGNEVHEKLTSRNLPDSTPSALVPRSILERDLGRPYCGCGFPLVPSDCDAANADLENQLGDGVSYDYRAYYSIRGSVVAFACAKTYDYEISGARYASMISDVTEACGQYISGTWGDYYNGGADGDVGYMQYVNGMDFCGASEGSSSHSC